VSRAAERSVDAVAQILSNYQAALHLLEEAVPSGEVLTPVRDACAGMPGLVELVDEAMAASTREQIAATHSRLIRRRPALAKAADARDETAGRLEELEAGSHSAGALFQLLIGR
jgi:hypothetical protein